MSKKIRNIVRKYLKNVKKAGIPLTKVYLFGSHAQGTARPDSDVDLCIISVKFGHDRQGERVMLMNLRDKTTDIIEPHPFSPDDFQNSFDPFSNEIKRTGIVV